MDPEQSFTRVIGRLKAGDDAAAGEVVARFSRRLAALAQGRLSPQIRQKVDAEDVLQSVFKSFFVRHAGGQIDPTGWDNLWTLLTVIAVRKCAKRWNYYRADRRDVGREAAIDGGSEAEWQPFDREPTPDEAVAVADTVEHLMRGLDERGRDILTLRLQGLLVEEIAREVGCAERTVRRVLDRVKVRLQSLDAGDTPSPDATPEPRHG